MQRSGVKRVAFYGVSDEMEIAYITLQGLDMKLAAIIDTDEERQGTNLFGHRVVSPRQVKTLRPDAILVTSMKDQNSLIKTLLKQSASDSIKTFTI